MSYTTINEHYAVWPEEPNPAQKYLFFRTKDNSPSISLANPIFRTELMHSVDGAFTETVYLYEPVIDCAAASSDYCRFLSVGLGMGYIEIMVVAYFLKHGLLNKKKLQIFSFEKDNCLRDFFVSYFLGGNLPKIFEHTYDEIVNLYGNKYEINSRELKLSIKKSIENNEISFYQDFGLHVHVPQKVNGIFLMPLARELLLNSGPPRLLLMFLHNVQHLALSPPMPLVPI